MNTKAVLTTDINLKDGLNSDGSDRATFTPVPLFTNGFCGHHVGLANGSILHVGGDESFSRNGSAAGLDYSYNGRTGRRIFVITL